MGRGSSDPELLRDRRGVEPAGAAEGHQRELPRVDAALHRHHAQRADHLGVGDLDDPLGGLLEAEAQLVAERGDGALGGLAVQLDPARDPAGEAEQEVGVGHRRVLAAVPVRGGAGACAGGA